MVDDGVGQVLAKLQEKGVLENTLVIYTADHGKSMGHHGFWGHGEDTWPSNMHHSANSIPLLSGETTEFRDEVFMEQEETRAIRTSKWLFMKRLENTKYGFKDELYDLVNDPDERVNLAQDPYYAEVVTKLSSRVEEFFTKYANPRWDLWKGGTVKSNSTRPFLWEEVWGEDWTPEF